MKEKVIEKKVCDYATKNGILNFKFNSESTRGVPDRIFFHKGKVFFIEFKTTVGKISKLQEYMFDVLRSENFEVFIVNKFSEGQNIIDIIKNENSN